MAPIRRKNRVIQQQPDHRANRTILLRTLLLLLIFGIAAFLPLFVKLYEIQITKHDDYLGRAIDQQTRDSEVTASRGTIYDCNGAPLAMSYTVHNIQLSPYGVQELQDKYEDAVEKAREKAKEAEQMKKLEDEAYVLKEKYTVSEKAVVRLLEEKAAPLLQGPENAYITRTEDGQLNIVDEKEGETIDEKGMSERITKYLNEKWKHEPFSLELAVIREKPEIIRADLEEVTDELGSFSTYAGGGQRWTNLKTGVGKLNGVILMPGEELSVYDTTAPYDEEHGYVEGTAYENGQVVPSYGGGICQVSSTLYNAVIYAELEIVERYPHSMAVDYVEPSRDAAIAGGVMDFRFKNPYSAPIYIFGEIDSSNQLRVVIYGKETRPENRSIEFESETLSTENYGVTYKAAPGLAFGQMQYTGSPHTGREARLWKVVYENGTEVSRDIFNTSSYAKSDQIVEVGTAGGSAEAVSALEAAIASQDGNAINSAIQAGYGGYSGGNEESGASEDGGGTESQQEDVETGIEQ